MRAVTRGPIVGFLLVFFAVAAIAAGCTSGSQMLLGSGQPPGPTPAPTPTPTLMPACTPSPAGAFTFKPNCLSFQSSTAPETMTASESGYNGTISVDQKNSTCLTNPPNQPPLGLALISPLSGSSGQTYSVTPQVFSGTVQSGYCQFTFTDSNKHSAQYQIEIDSTIVIIQDSQHRVK